MKEVSVKYSVTVRELRSLLEHFPQDVLVSFSSPDHPDQPVNHIWVNEDFRVYLESRKS